MGPAMREVCVQRRLLRAPSCQLDGVAPRRHTGAHLHGVHLLPFNSKADIRSEERPESQLQQSASTRGYFSERQ